MLRFVTRAAIAADAIVMCIKLTLAICDHFSRHYVPYGRSKNKVIILNE